jgi:mono/diheme cytochrome c family protein
MPPFLETPVAPRPAIRPAAVAKGKQLYEANCIQCHGAEGKGDGYGAPFLVPPPRDFTAGQFKFRTTAGGQLPTDEDLFRTISRGANGTGMPPWKYLLNDEERWALVEYVKTFEPRFANARALGAPQRRNRRRRGTVHPRVQLAPSEASEGRPMLRLTGITKTFDGRRVLDGVELEIGAGESVAMLGANGPARPRRRAASSGWRGPTQAALSSAASTSPVLRIARARASVIWRRSRSFRRR